MTGRLKFGIIKKLFPIFLYINLQSFIKDKWKESLFQNKTGNSGGK